MKRVLVIIITLIYSAFCWASLPIIDPALREEMNRRGDNEKIKINILMLEQSDPTALQRVTSQFATQQERRNHVMETLKRQAEISQADLLDLLEEMERNGMVEGIQSYWLVNCVSCKANQSAINDLAQRRDIKTIYHLEETRWIFDEAATPAPRGDGREITENLLQVNAPQAWELGFTGNGVLVGLIDTGVRLDHADLAGRLWDGGPEYPNHGYDFYYHDNDPSDDRGHGTHLAGTICGTGAFKEPRTDACANRRDS